MYKIFGCVCLCVCVFVCVCVCVCVCSLCGFIHRTIWNAVGCIVQS